jgi:hypothetical protein
VSFAQQQVCRPGSASTAISSRYQEGRLWQLGEARFELLHRDTHGAFDRAGLGNFGSVTDVQEEDRLLVVEALLQVVRWDTVRHSYLALG